MNRLAGILLVIVSAATFASLAIFGRFAYAAGLDVSTLLFLRFSFSAVVMLGLLLTCSQARRVAPGLFSEDG